jgi:hypothetical protein
MTYDLRVGGSSAALTFTTVQVARPGGTEGDRTLLTALTTQLPHQMHTIPWRPDRELNSALELRRLKCSPLLRALGGGGESNPSARVTADHRAARTST